MTKRGSYEPWKQLNKCGGWLIIKTTQADFDIPEEICVVVFYFKLLEGTIIYEMFSKAVSA